MGKKHAKTKEKKFSFKVLWISLGIVFVLVTAAFYGYKVNYFTTHFGYNTEINGIDCSLMTVEEVQEIIDRKYHDYEILITGRDGFRAYITGKEIGIERDYGGQIEKLLEQQDPYRWFIPWLTGESFKATVEQPKIAFKHVGVTNKLKALKLFDEDTRVLPEDAYIDFRNNKYVIVPEIMGNVLDRSRTTQLILDAMYDLTTEIDLEKEGCYSSPEKYSDDPEMNDTINTWNKYACFYIIYTFGDGWTEEVTPPVAMQWVDIAPDGTGTLNEARLREWLREFGLKYDTIGKKRTFMTVSGEVAEVEGGTYGWEVDEKAEFEAIKYAYYNHIGETREPIYVRRGVERGAPGTPDWGNSYIELDLTKQCMYYIQDGEVVFECLVVTGSLLNGKTSTPEGVWTILEKTSPTVLVGNIMPDGFPEYEAPVSYWMRMTWDGHGFHDATWQPWFGGNRYTYAGSHGCINMPYSAAEKLYDLVSLGTPVVSHF